ncbi:MAG: bacteriocin [Chitinophagaceae bacterium]|nr:bacteriocin [Chitinophagaceae bacterium]
MKKLSKEEMKKIIGGEMQGCPFGEKSCITTSDCNQGDACTGIPGCCYAVSLGTKCTSDIGCGQGQKCVDSGYGYKWCSY